MMKTIFDEQAGSELIQRISNLSATDTAQWGKMNVYQMMQHCILWNEWILGTKEYAYRQEFLGFIFGRIALRRMIKDDRPLDKNVPTSTFLIIKDASTDIHQMKDTWSRLMKAYATFSNPRFIHDFFGKMSEQEIGILVYKHMDHHLRQFSR